MLKKGMRHKMKPGYLHYSFFFFLENCIHISDWVGLFWLLCCLRKSVTNRECSSTRSLYSIWPAPVARGNTPGNAFSFCLSYFLISQRCCRLSALSATEAAQSPATRPQSVFMVVRWSHILHFTLLSQSDCQGETGTSTRHVGTPHE